MSVSAVLDSASVDVAPRLLFSVALRPAQGTRFQPTGFPDLGAATFVIPQSGGSGTQGLLVESAQSMANRLEAVCWDAATGDLVETLRGLSYVRVLDKKDELLTTSILEAHRLNSYYIESAGGGGFKKQLEGEIGASKDRPIDYRRFTSTVLKYDACSLIHGVFLESIDGRLRVTRALSAFIEAEDASIAASGGVKNDHVSPKKLEGKGAASGQGNVPFHREEFTAQRITAYINLDLAQIRGYGLGQTVEQMLVALALFKIRALLDGNLRLRTACDFEVVESTVVADRPAGFTLPDKPTLEALVKASIAACADQMAGVTVVKYA